MADQQAAVKVSLASRIARQSAHSTFFFGLNFLARALLMLALGRGLSTKDYGVYSLVATTITTVVTILQLGAHSYFMREVPGIPRGDALTVFKGVLAIETVLVVMLLSLVLMMPGVPQAFSSWLGIESAWPLLLIVAALILIGGVSSEVARYLSARTEIEQYNVMAFLETGVWPFAVLMSFMLASDSLSVVWVMTLWLLSPLIALLYGFSCVGFHEFCATPIRATVYPAAVRFGFPLMGTMLASLTLGWSDRYFIQAFHSSQALGVYSYYYNIIAMIVAVSAPLIASALDPHVVAAHNVGEIELSQRLLSASLRYRLIVVIPMVLVVVFWSDTIIRFLATADYARGGILMAWLAPIPLLMVAATSLERVLFLSRWTGIIGGCYVIAGIADLALNYVLVPLHPYYGAAWATDLALILLVGLLLYQARRAEVRIGEGIWRVLGAAGPALLAAWLVHRGLDASHPILSLVVGMGAVTLVFGLALLAFRAISQVERRVAVDLFYRVSKRVYVQ